MRARRSARAVAVLDAARRIGQPQCGHRERNSRHTGDKEGVAPGEVRPDLTAHDVAERRPDGDRHVEERIDPRPAAAGGKRSASSAGAIATSAASPMPTMARAAKRCG